MEDRLVPSKRSGVPEHKHEYRSEGQSCSCGAQTALFERIRKDQLSGPHVADVRSAGLPRGADVSTAPLQHGEQARIAKHGPLNGEHR
jgi:hypothetical protein